MEEEVEQKVVENEELHSEGASSMSVSPCNVVRVVVLLLPMSACTHLLSSKRRLGVVGLISDACMLRAAQRTTSCRSRPKRATKCSRCRRIWSVPFFHGSVFSF
jgi:hypothetical protein